MKVNEIYAAALSLDSTLREQDDSLKPHVLSWVNICLQDMLCTENSILLWEGKEMLREAPQLTSMDDEVPYHAQLVRTALPYFIAHQILKDDDNNAWASRYYDMYLHAVNEAAVMLPQDGSETDVWR